MPVGRKGNGRCNCLGRISGIDRLAQVQVSPGPRREAWGERVLEQMILTRSLEEVFFARRCVGTFSGFHCSASRASLVQVRPTSSRMPFTRACTLLP
jgi:hypothetical protein